MTKIKLIPLKQFICDKCGKVITDMCDGFVDWDITERKDGEDWEDRKYCNFHIIHGIPYSRYSTLKEGEDCCYHKNHTNLYLCDFTGAEGIAEILYFLEPGPVFDPEYKDPSVEDIRDWAELVRRLHIPYYEEARQYFSVAKADGFFKDILETSCYSPHILKELIEKYSES